ncbi:MAG: hypothetical protein AB8H12_17440 [Lewinella sp.]
MKLLKLLIFALCLSTSLGAQSTERFVRIVGNAKKEIQASKAEVYFTVSEVKESSYNDMKGKPYAAAYGEVLMKLNEIGVDTNAIEGVLKTGGRFSKVISNSFSVKMDVSKAEKMRTLSSPGL